MANLVLLDDVKEHLDITKSDHDAELMEYIEATTVVVEDYIGPVTAKTYVERHPSGDRLVLFHPPALTLTSVNYWLTGGTAYATNVLKLDTEHGIVERTDGYCFTGGPFEVTYTAGRATVPSNVRLASLIIIGHLWETQRGRSAKISLGGNSDDPQGLRPPGMSYAVPNRALELLGPKRVVVA